jgi:hypothetical protein
MPEEALCSQMVSSGIRVGQVCNSFPELLLQGHAFPFGCGILRYIIA